FLCNNQLMGHAQTSPEPLTAPSWQEITAAHARISPRIHRTPVLTSKTMDRLSGAQLFFKCENVQKTGSFKIRGATNAVFSLSDERPGMASLPSPAATMALPSPVQQPGAA